MHPDKKGHRRRGRIRVGPARQVDHELTSEQIRGRIVELKKAVPFENAGPPEWHRESEAQHKLHERRLRDETHDAAQKS
jgi:hypothetical protein